MFTFNNVVKEPVKFGDAPDLTKTECYGVLRRHMPPHVTTSKVLQQLFIKYERNNCMFTYVIATFFSGIWKDDVNF